MPRIGSETLLFRSIFRAGCFRQVCDVEVGPWGCVGWLRSLRPGCVERMIHVRSKTRTKIGRSYKAGVFTVGGTIPNPPANMAKLTFILQLATLAISANAHAIFQQLYVNGVDQGHLTGIRVPDYDGVRQHVVIFYTTRANFLYLLSLSKTSHRTTSSVMAGSTLTTVRSPSLLSPFLLVGRLRLSGITHFKARTQVTPLTLSTQATRVQLSHICTPFSKFLKFRTLIVF